MKIKYLKIFDKLNISKHRVVRQNNNKTKRGIAGRDKSAPTAALRQAKIYPTGKLRLPQSTSLAVDVHTHTCANQREREREIER